MASRSRKTTGIYLLVLSTVLRHTYCQINQGFVNGATGHTSSTLKQTHSAFFYPENRYVYPHPAAKGFYPVSPVNSYYADPINGQYWTGHPLQYAKFPHYPQFQQRLLKYPTPYHYYPQQFGNALMKTGYNNYHGQFPFFNANYWMGNNYHPMHISHFPMSPAYLHQVPMYHNPMFYQGHPMMYNGHYPYHAVPFPAYEYYGNYYDRGFFGGTGRELAKGLLGALLVGAVAGTVARRG